MFITVRVDDDRTFAVCHSPHIVFQCRSESVATAADTRREADRGETELFSCLCAPSLRSLTNECHRQWCSARRKRKNAEELVVIVRPDFGVENEVYGEEMEKTKGRDILNLTTRFISSTCVHGRPVQREVPLGIPQRDVSVTYF